MKVQASSVHRIHNCPGSLYLEKSLADTDKYRPFSEAASFGSNIHDVAEKQITAAIYKKKGGTLNKMLNEKGYKKGSEEHLQGTHIVKEYVKLIKRIVKKHEKTKGKTQIFIEDKFRAFYNKLELVFKCDFMIVTTKNDGSRVIDIVDLKTGNYDYSESAVLQLKFSYFVFALLNPLKEADMVTFTISQPRYYYTEDRAPSLQEGPFEQQDIIQYVSILQSHLKSQEFNTGDHCSFCPCMIKCPSLNALVPVISSMSKTKEIDLSAVSNEKLEAIFEQKRNIESFLKAVESAIRNRLVEGESFSTLAIKTTSGRRKWIDEKLVEKAFKDEDIYAPAKLKSPAQLEKIIGKEKIIDFVEKPMVKKLVKKENPFKEVG